MRAGAARLMALLSIAPFLVAASDPEGDVAGCLGGAGSGAPDLVEVNGEIVELGTSARWELTFAEPLTVPDGGSIDDTVYEFSSVLRFIEDLHGLKPMTGRDRRADPLSGAFDFSQEPRLGPLIVPPRDCPSA